MSAGRQSAAMTSRYLAAFSLSAAVFVLAPFDAYAECAPTSAGQRWELATVIIDVRALEGPTPTGVQRFRVLRYLKGHGPAVIRVSTGVARATDGSGWGSGEGLLVRRGQRWRIFARGSSSGILRTSACDGSWRYGGGG